jgi:hypothetical protein
MTQNCLLGAVLLTNFEKMNNLKNFDNKRAKALEWWRNLKPDQQNLVAKLHFPNIDFFLITTSSSRIQIIWEKQVGS